MFPEGFLALLWRTFLNANMPKMEFAWGNLVRLVAWTNVQDHLCRSIPLLPFKNLASAFPIFSVANAEVLIAVPLRALLDQFAVDFPGFCKVGMGHNEKIDFDAKCFIAVTPSVHLLQKLRFDAVFVDEAHHPLPKKLPKAKELFQFSATLEQEEGIDFQYTMGKAIEDGVLCDYDITVPAVTAHHAYVCLADLLVKQAGRFRRVLAYCNTVAEAKRFQMVLEELGLAAWHINAKTGWKERKRVMDEFTGVLKKPVHVLVTVEVLGEGINIPNADTCMFVEPRNSYRSIIQAIGRVLRHHPSKPLGHIVLPAVAVPERGPDHVPVPPSSAESKLQTKNCKEQELSQKTHVARSSVELPGCPGGQEHSADQGVSGPVRSGCANFGPVRSGPVCCGPTRLPCLSLV